MASVSYTHLDVYKRQLVDGPFLLEQKSLMLRFRGSKNQRVIDPQASLVEGRAVEKEF